MGFNGALVNCHSVAGNLRSVKEHSEVVWKYIRRGGKGGREVIRSAGQGCYSLGAY